MLRRSASVSPVHAQPTKAQCAPGRSARRRARPTFPSGRQERTPPQVPARRAVSASNLARGSGLSAAGMARTTNSSTSGNSTPVRLSWPPLSCRNLLCLSLGAVASPVHFSWALRARPRTSSHFQGLAQVWYRVTRHRRPARRCDRPGMPPPRRGLCAGLPSGHCASRHERSSTCGTCTLAPRARLHSALPRSVPSSARVFCPGLCWSSSTPTEFAQQSAARRRQRSVCTQEHKLLQRSAQPLWRRRLPRSVPRSLVRPRPFLPRC